MIFFAEYFFQEFVKVFRTHVVRNLVFAFSFFNSNVSSMLSFVGFSLINIYATNVQKIFKYSAHDCYRSFANAEKLFREKKKQLSGGRTLTQEKYIRIKTVQMAKLQGLVKTKISLQLSIAEAILPELISFQFSW